MNEPAVTTTVVMEDVEIGSGVARLLTLERPAQRNPLDGTAVRELRRLVEGADDDPAVRILVITGSGPAFSAGGDLRAYLELYRDATSFRAYLDEFRLLNDGLERGRFVSIAMVNGACVAGGLELALACDLITIADEATIGDAHIRTGQIAGAGGTQRLVRALGRQRAKQLLLRGHTLSGPDAVHEGLALLSAPSAELRARTLELAAELAAHSPLAIQHLKHLVGLTAELPFEAALTAEIDAVVGYATGSADATEGLLAFLDRRPAQYQGR